MKGTGDTEASSDVPIILDVSSRGSYDRDTMGIEIENPDGQVQEP